MARHRSKRDQTKHLDHKSLDYSPSNKYQMRRYRKLKKRLMDLVQQIDELWLANDRIRNSKKNYSPIPNNHGQ